MKQEAQNVPGFRYLKPSHKARRIERIPPRAAPTTTPRDTPFIPVLVGVVIGIKEKLEYMVAATKRLNQM